jgi:hypothetical protein
LKDIAQKWTLQADMQLRLADLICLGSDHDISLSCVMIVATSDVVQVCSPTNAPMPKNGRLGGTTRLLSS